MAIIERLKSGWTLLKIIRVGLGGLILYSSIETGHLAGMILGGMFTTFSLLTDGVCSAGGSCYTSSKKLDRSTIENTTYEELGNQ